MISYVRSLSDWAFIADRSALEKVGGGSRSAWYFLKNEGEPNEIRGNGL